MFLKNETKGNKCKMWKSQLSTWDFQDYDQDFQNSDPGSQDFLFQKVSASTDLNYKTILIRPKKIIPVFPVTCRKKIGSVGRNFFSVHIDVAHRCRGINKEYNYTQS